MLDHLAGWVRMQPALASVSRRASFSVVILTQEHWVPDSQLKAVNTAARLKTQGLDFLMRLKQSPGAETVLTSLVWMALSKGWEKALR